MNKRLSGINPDCEEDACRAEKKQQRIDLEMSKCSRQTEHGTEIKRHVHTDRHYIIVWYLVSEWVGWLTHPNTKNTDEFILCL